MSVTLENLSWIFFTGPLGISGKKKNDGSHNENAFKIPYPWCFSQKSKFFSTGVKKRGNSGNSRMILKRILLNSWFGRSGTHC